MIGLGLYNRHRLGRVETGVAAEGTVVADTFKGWKGYVVISFDTPQGNVAHRFSSRGEHPEVGTRVKLWYRPGDPAGALTEMERKECSRWQVYMGMGILVLLIAFALAMWTRWEWRLKRDLVARGEVVDFRTTGFSEIEYDFAGKTYRRKAEVGAYAELGDVTPMAAFVDPNKPLRMFVAPRAWAGTQPRADWRIPKKRLAFFLAGYLAFFVSVAMATIGQLRNTPPGFFWLAMPAVSGFVLVAVVLDVVGFWALLRKRRAPGA